MENERALKMQYVYSQYTPKSAGETKRNFMLIPTSWQDLVVPGFSVTLLVIAFETWHTEIQHTDKCLV